MSKRTIFFVQAPLLACLVLLAASERSEAQHRGFVHRGRGFGTPFFFWPLLGGLNTGGLYPGGFYPGGYYPGGYYDPGYYSSPSYSTSYYYSQPTLIYIAPMLPQTPTSSDSSYQSDRENAARIEIKVPAAAELWFDGKKTKQTGDSRSFATPPLRPGQVYTYDVRATWKDDSGATVTRTRTVDIQAGQKAVVNMMEVD